MSDEIGLIGHCIFAIVPDVTFLPSIMTRKAVTRGAAVCLPGFHPNKAIRMVSPLIQKVAFGARIGAAGG